MAKPSEMDLQTFRQKLATIVRDVGTGPVTVGRRSAIDGALKPLLHITRHDSGPEPGELLKLARRSQDMYRIVAAVQKQSGGAAARVALKEANATLDDIDSRNQGGDA